MKTKLLALFATLTLAGCNSPDSTPAAAATDGLDELANEYLFLELSMGLHDKAHVDAYFGPGEFKAAAEAEAMSLEDIELAASDLMRRLYEVSSDDGPLVGERRDGLMARLDALRMRIAINKGEPADFDKETLFLFATRVPDNDATYFESILQQLDAIVPGEGPLSKRVESFNDQFVIPPAKLSAVFEAAMDECRLRTKKFIDLPDNESFTIEYVNNVPWSGYNWYQGNAQSLIQINTDFPIYISRAVDLGCHEGYPGHHTFNALLEKNLVNDLGWIEHSLYPLFSPQSLIAEGSGNYGIELAFPGDERMQYEKEVLFPLAGLDATNADLYYEILALTEQLNFAHNEAARDYLNGEMTREEAAQWLQDYGMMREDKSYQRTEFIDAYRSYVINYNHGKVLVAGYIEAGDPDIEERWARFEKLLSSPMLPRDLIPSAAP